jgi:tetratricopeptide (TPR) repeat protein
MKKFFLLIAVVSISVGAMSQKGKVTSALGYIDQGVLDKAKVAIDQALVHEKSKNWPNTFFAVGKLAQASYESDNATFKAYFTNPLQEAYKSYEKAIALDKKGSMKKKIITGMVYSSLAADLYAQGSDRFTENDFEGALKAFETQIEITESDKYAGSIDTGMYYNAGLAAINSGNQNQAIKYFQTCADMQYLGITPYFQIYEAYMGLGDTATAEATLMSLTDIFPNDNSITLQLIDLYIKSGKNDEALKYIKVAKEADPDNYSLYFAAGIMYLNQELYDLAIEELVKSIEIKSDYYETQYGLGAAYINKASNMFVAANEIMDVQKYSDAIDVANAVYAKALPYMEKALEIVPDDRYAMESLKELYYRMKMTDKYDTIKAKLDAMDNQ